MTKFLSLLILTLLSPLASACAAQYTTVPSPAGSREINDRAEAEGWVNFVLTYNYCTGAPDPQRYASPTMQRTIEYVIQSQGGQQSASPANWQVARRSDGRIETALPFTSDSAAKTMRFVIDPNRNVVTPQDSFADQAVRERGCDA